MKCRLISLGFAFGLIWSTAGLAATSQGYGMGGPMARFQPVIDRANQSGELFRITGHCQSACTTFLGIRNVCVERSARLLFHAGHDRHFKISAYWTERIASAYNAPLRQYLTAGRHMETLATGNVRGSEPAGRPLARVPHDRQVEQSAKCPAADPHRLGIVEPQAL